MREPRRLSCIDNLRLLIIVFVVMVHSAVTYSGIGSWYYVENSQLDIPSAVFFAYFLSFTQAYSMGFLFMLAGYFTPGSYARKGRTQFVADRLVRLGVPALFYMAVVNPIQNYLYVIPQVPKPAFLAYYAYYMTSMEFPDGSGPLWFALALLAFDLTYAAVRGQRSAEQLTRPLPGPSRVAGFIALMAALSFLVRLALPIDTSVLNMQLCFFSQYVMMFLAGNLAYQHGWLEQIPSRAGKAVFRWALLGCPVLWVLLMIIGGIIPDGFDLIKGGLRWQALAYALWESLAVVFTSIGLIVLFRERYGGQNALIKAMSQSAFAVYVLHAPITIGIAMAMRPLLLPPIMKFLLLSVLSLTASFGFAHFVVKRIPIVNRIL